MPRTLPLLVLGFLLLTLGCGDGQDTTAPADEGAAPGGADVAAGGAPDSLPPARRGTLTLGGQAVPVTLARYVTPEGFPLPFYTYHPDDMLAQLVSTGEGETVRFTANPGGRLTNDANVQFYIFPVDLAQEEAAFRMRQVAQGHAKVVEQPSRFDWSLTELGFEGNDMAGTYALGRHGGRFFYILVSRPPALADDFTPYVDAILDAWRWQDTGTGLAEEAGA